MENVIRKTITEEIVGGGEERMCYGGIEFPTKTLFFKRLK